MCSLCLFSVLSDLVAADGRSYRLCFCSLKQLQELCASPSDRIALWLNCVKTLPSLHAVKKEHLVRTRASLVIIDRVAPSPLSSISVDSRPLLRVYYSQPPTLLCSPSTPLLSLRGFCPQSQERSKSFTDLQSSREPQNKGEERKQSTTQTAAALHMHRLIGRRARFADLLCICVEAANQTPDRSTFWLSV